MRYKVGDIVQIKTRKELLASGWIEDKTEKDYTRENGFHFSVEMKKHYGAVLKVSFISEVDKYKEVYRLENTSFFWTEDMFAPNELEQVLEEIKREVNEV